MLYLIDVNQNESESSGLSAPDKLALAQRALQKYRSACFWYCRDDFQASEKNLDMIIRGLRRHGNREAFLIAAALCR